MTDRLTLDEVREDVNRRHDALAALRVLPSTAYVVEKLDLLTRSQLGPGLAARLVPFFTAAVDEVLAEERQRLERIARGDLNA